MGWKEVFTKQALPEVKIRGKFALGNEGTVEPVKGAGTVLYAMAVCWVVGHDFGCPVVPTGVDLGENDAAV